jgi:hypothetical protein
MSEFDPIAYIKEVGGVVKFGSGVLGKSAIALGILLFGIVIAAARLHSDGAIIAALVLGAGVFFAWLFYVLRFASQHPDVAVLEGAEWSSFQRFQAAAKGFVPDLSDKAPVPLPGSQAALPGEPPLLTADEEGGL